MLDKVSKTDPRISLYQPEQEGLFPEIPAFKDFAAEREYRKQHIWSPRSARSPCKRSSFSDSRHCDRRPSPAPID